MDAAPASAEARRFGKYTLVAKLATGGMAEISTVSSVTATCPRTRRTP